jgi:hypothetical protein
MDKKDGWTNKTYLSSCKVNGHVPNEKVYAHSLLSIGWSRFIPEQYFFCDDKKFPAENNKTYFLYNPHES